jgi:hypothetical protein
MIQIRENLIKLRIPAPRLTSNQARTASKRTKTIGGGKEKTAKNALRTA